MFEFFGMALVLFHSLMDHVSLHLLNYETCFHLIDHL